MNAVILRYCTLLVAKDHLCMLRLILTLTFNIYSVTRYVQQQKCILCTLILMKGRGPIIHMFGVQIE